MDLGLVWRWLDKARRWQWVRAICEALADMLWVLFPSDCVSCGVRDAVLCDACLKSFHRATLQPFRAEEAAEALPFDLETNSVLPVWAAGLYKDVVPATLLAFKNHQRFSLKKELGRALARSLHQAIGSTEATGAFGAIRGKPVVIVPIPASAASMRKRGYWPVGELLEEALKTLPATGEIHVASLLSVSGSAGSSHRGASAKDRRSRRGKMRVVTGAVVPESSAVLIVDDVLTTGATLAQAYEVLHQAGFEVSGAAVLAATQNPR